MLASIGAAVGIGNIWRFSAVAGQNGGGAYLVPYLISIAAFAVPLMVLEFAAGREFKGTVVSAFATIQRRLSVLGWLIHTIVFCIPSVRLAVADVRVLDLMDDTLGTLGLPTSAILMVLVFRWLTGRDILRSQVPGLNSNFLLRLLDPLTKYAIPLVLAAILLLTLVSGEGALLRILPERPVLGTVTRDVVAFVVLPLLLASTLLVVRLLRRRGKAAPTAL